MDILTCIEASKTTLSIKELLLKKIEEFISPIIFDPSSLKYGEFIEGTSLYFNSLIRDFFKNTLEKMDMDFYYSETRKIRYYSKGVRKRTLITIFGDFTFLRHEYVDIHTGKRFIYVDEKLGLKRKQRYDNTISALAYDYYSYLKSMNEVGKVLGERILGFSLNLNRNKHHIHRQTIYKMLHRFKTIIPPIQEVKQTPESIYIIADEKFISSQHNNNKDIETREIVIYEGLTSNKHFDSITGELTYKRNSLINPYKIATTSTNVFDIVSEVIMKRYDTNKLKHVYLMGDGGIWIEAGVNELKSVDYDVSFALDKFHFKQAINNMTDNKEEKRLLYEYSISNKVKEFKELTQTLITNSPNKEETIKSKAKYILNHFKAIRHMYKDVKIGCPMEQAISHDLASHFSCIPKAYGTKWYPTYLNERINKLNNYDLVRLYLQAIDESNKTKETDNINLEPKLYTSFFDSQIKDEYYKLNINLYTPKIS